MAFRPSIRSRFGAVCTPFFNWVAPIAAIVAFIVGVTTGVGVQQPILTASATSRLLSDTRDLERFLLRAETTQAKNLDDKIKILDKAEDATKSALTAPSSAGHERAVSDALNKVSEASTALRQAVDSQNLAYDRKLSDDVMHLRVIEERLRMQADASHGFWPALYDFVKRFLKWIGAVSFATVTTFTLFILLMTNPNVRRRIGKNGIVSAFGISFDFSDVQMARASVQARQTDIENDVKGIYTRTLRNSGLWTHFNKVMTSISEQFKVNEVDLGVLDYRATLFVPGFVGQELVQATRYVGTHELGDETKVGRRFSVRFGIIGRAWRLKTSQYYPNVTGVNNNLVRDWGFTQDEAKPASAAAGGRTGSLMAFCLGDAAGTPPLGVIYIEAEGGDKLHPMAVAPPIDDPDANGMTSADKFAASIWSNVDSKAKERLRNQLARLQDLIRWNDKIQQGEGR